MGGFAAGRYSGHSDGGRVVNPDSEIYGRTFPAHDYINVSWFNLDIYVDNQGWKNLPYGTIWAHTKELYEENIILLIFIYGVLFSAPFVATVMMKHKCKGTALSVTDNNIYGTYKKRDIMLPMETVNSIGVLPKTADKFHAGTTIGVGSDFGVYEFSFVQNVDEVLAAAMGPLQACKAKVLPMQQMQPVQPATQPVTINTKQILSDKLKELIDLKEQGLITADEYDALRKKALDIK